MRHFDAAATRHALPFDALIGAIEAMFVAGCEVPPRHVHAIDNQPGGELTPGTVLIMPAWQERYMGIKTVNIFPGNAARGMPALFSTYILYDAATGEPLAQIDGNEITARRTAAASALAARYLAPPGAASLLVVGSGRVASLLPYAYRQVLSLQEVIVWSRNPNSAMKLAAQLCADGFDARASIDLDAAARGADIVACATLATEPIIRGEWLRPGSHLDLIGSFTPRMREADDACFAGARLFVDTLEALQKSGDLLHPIARGVFAPSDIGGTLEALCRGQAKGRRGNERTVFKSVGTALEDLAAAMLVLENSGGKKKDTNP
ncbi:ornithine cyclodeaminase family protein [Massilia psychrophila]|uniref:Ornithine cyclodeaminase n=1 Tax=Massilia psychrophila TaxID=1603353 RepID=A0A2G8T848_9BURK|nr:ornithine cyclodeaminase family protein [Massilia psychrophila]PIL41828.1 ornithine cyclodeaminase [Massilia psychrophila]